MRRLGHASPAAANRYLHTVEGRDAEIATALPATTTLEFELRRVQHFTSRTTTRAKVAAWIEDYNSRRRHSAGWIAEWRQGG